MAKKVCIDAGHFGKYNRSPVVPTYYESDFNFKLQGYLVEELNKYGIDSVVTRTNQAVDLGLGARGAVSKGCDLFVSLHSNACSTESVDSIDVYAMTKDSDISIDDTSREIADVIGKALYNVMSFTSGYRVLTRASTKDKDGDGKADDEYYGVLSGAKKVGTPGILIEHSFHTNTEATLWLLEDANVRRIAAAEAKALADYWGISSKNTTEVPTQGSVTPSPSEPTTGMSLVDLTDGLPSTASTPRYRVRYMSSGAQSGAFKILTNAKSSVDRNKTYCGVYDAEQGNKLVYYYSPSKVELPNPVVKEQAVIPEKVVANGVSKERTVCVTASMLMVRAEPTTKSKALASLVKGEIVTVLSEATRDNLLWGKVVVKNKTGYIALKYTK